jgi:hypothetical protein
MKRRILRKVFAHYYRSGRVGLLFVTLSSRADKLLRLDITHEAHPTLEQSDTSEFRRVLASELSEVANLFDLEFSVLIPQLRLGEGAPMFAFSPSRNPVSLPSPPGICITPPWEVVNLRRSRRELLYAREGRVQVVPQAETKHVSKQAVPNE